MIRASWTLFFVFLVFVPCLTLTFRLAASAKLMDGGGGGDDDDDNVFLTGFLILIAVSRVGKSSCTKVGVADDGDDDACCCCRMVGPLGLLLVLCRPGYSLSSNRTGLLVCCCCCGLLLILLATS